MQSEIPGRIESLLKAPWSTHPDIRKVLVDAAKEIRQFWEGVRTVCIHCREDIPQDERETHWERCTKHPARVRIDELEQALRGYKFRYELACDDVATLRRERTKARLQRDEYSEELDEAQIEIKKWIERLDKLEREIQTEWASPDEVTAAAERHEVQRCRIVELNKIIDEQFEKIKELERENARLVNSRSAAKTENWKAIIRQREERNLVLCREYKELAAAVWGCDVECLGNVTHASTVQEAYENSGVHDE